MPREEVAFTAWPKIQSQSQIVRYGRSIFCLPHQPIFSDIFDLCLQWVSVVRALSAYKCHKGNSKKVISKKFRKWFHSCTCILPDYVSDESSKEF